MEHPAGCDRPKCEPELAASKDGARPALVEPFLRGENLYATDSYIAVRLPVKLDDGDVDGPVPAATLKAARSNRSFQHVLLNGSAVALGKDGRLEVPRGGDDWEYPQIDQLIPATPLPVRICLNADKLAQAAKALGTSGIVLEFDPELKSSPMVVRPVEHRDNRVAVVMPVRMPGWALAEEVREDA